MNRIKELRTENKITQADLAKVLKISDRAVGYYESGEREPDQDTLLQIADYFDVSVDYLLGRTNIRNTSESNNEEIQVAFSSGFAGLNEENKKLAVDIIAGLKAKQDLEDK